MTCAHENVCTARGITSRGHQQPPMHASTFEVMLPKAPACCRDRASDPIHMPAADAIEAYVTSTSNTARTIAKWTASGA